MSTSLSFKRWAALDLVNVVAGLCLGLAPWYLGFASHAVAAWNAWIIGALILIVASAAISAEEWKESDANTWEWINFALGVWAAVSPWVLGFELLAGAKIVSLVAGLIVAALAAIHLWLADPKGVSAA